MSFYNTGNPVPSIDPRDLDDNAKHLDAFVNGTEATYVDRLGAERRSLAGIESDADANVLRGELGDSSDQSKGAELVGFYDRAAPAYLKTLSDIANAGEVSITRFIDKEELPSLYDGTSVTDFTANIDEALEAMIGGGCLTLPPVTFNHNGLTSRGSRNLKIEGQGWKSTLKNNSTTGAPCLLIASSDIEERAYGLDISSLTLMGNPLSGNGLTVDRGGWYDHLGREASVTNIDRVQSILHGLNGMQIGKSATEGAGNKTNITRSLLRQNGRTGLLISGQTNIVMFSGGSITLNAQDGVEMNQVASTNHITDSFIADNTRYGAYAFRCEQPMFTHLGFNRNMQGAVVLSGNATGSVKYTEAALIAYCLFGDNGRDAATQREISIGASRGTNVVFNYFYGTGQDSMIYLSDYAEGVMISGNRPKDFTTEEMLEVKPGAINTFYTYDDDVGEAALRNIITNKVTQYVVGANSTLMQARPALTDTVPRWRVTGSGRTEYSSGSAAADVSFERVTAGALRVNASVEMNRCEIAEGLSAPSAKTGYSRQFIEGAGATSVLKVRYSNSAIKIVEVKVSVPATAASSGQPGDYAVDASFRYDYVGDGTTHSWVRSAVATW